MSIKKQTNYKLLIATKECSKIFYIYTRKETNVLVAQIDNKDKRGQKKTKTK